MHIFCDFDGTISDQDSTDLILQRLALPEWEAVEADWQAGRIDAAQCMRTQIGMIDASLDRVNAVLDGIGLRDGFREFAGWARQARVPFTIVSDGVDYFIQYILARHGLGNLQVVSNRLVPGAETGFELMQPHRRAGCGSGVCKCAIVDAVTTRGPVVYIGDGKSDFCVSAKPDLLFATNSLVGHCVDTGKAHQPFTDFHTVQAALQRVAMPASTQIAA